MHSHRPPWIENEDTMRIRTFIKLHTNGIQVDILKLPELYTAPSLDYVVSFHCWDPSACAS